MRGQAQQLKQALLQALDTLPPNPTYMLSGGLDSSALVCLQLSRGIDVQAICTDMRGQPCDESQYVRIIQKKYSGLHVFWIKPTEIDFLSELSEYVGILGQATPNGSGLIEYLIIKTGATHGVKDLVQGQWADELFMGYASMLIHKAREDWNKGNLLGTLRNIRRYHEIDQAVQSHIAWTTILGAFYQSKGLYGKREEAIEALQPQTAVADKVAEHFGLRIHLPYADSMVYEIAMGVSSSDMIHNGTSKVLLREAVSDIVPPEIIHRKTKFGMLAPDVHWIDFNSTKIAKKCPQEWRYWDRNQSSWSHRRLFEALCNKLLAE